MVGFVWGLIGGILVLICEQVYLYFRDKKKEDNSLIVRFTNRERRITGEIFNQLGPGSSIELMKQDLGPPNKKSKEEGGLLVAEGQEPYCEADRGTRYRPQLTAYLYFFKNAAVKITSEDCETVTSLTVMAHDTDISISNLYLGDGEETEYLNITKIDDEMLEGAQVDEFTGYRDCFAAIHKVIGHPFWIYQTFFTDDLEEMNDMTTVGATINGVCLSTSAETASYIYLSDYTSAI